MSNQKQKIHFFLTSLIEKPDKKFDNPFKIKVSYESRSGDKLEEKFEIDFSQFKGFPQLDEAPLHQIAKSLDGLNKNIAQLSFGNRRLKTGFTQKKY